MRHAPVLALASAAIAVALAGCSSPGNPWQEKADAYAATLSVADPGKVADYITTACADPNLSGPTIADRVGGAWDELTGTGLDGLPDAVQTVCPEKFPG